MSVAESGVDGPEGKRTAITNKLSLRRKNQAGILDVI